MAPRVRNIESRVIRYANPWEFPTADTLSPEFEHLQDHPVLDFLIGTDEHAHREKIKAQNIFKFRLMDQQLLQQWGELDFFTSLLGDKWEMILHPTERVFTELTFEFHSTFKWNENLFTEPRVFSFALGRTTHEMTAQQLGVALGFYTEAEVQEPGWVTLPRGLCKSKLKKLGVKHAALDEFWKTIGEDEFYSGMAESYIRNSHHRFLHRIIANTILGRNPSQEKVTYVDLYVLWAIIGANPVNLVSLFVESIRRPTRRQTAELPGGSYITRLDTFLGVFDWIPRRWFYQEEPATRYRHQDMATTQFCHLDLTLGFGLITVPESLPRTGKRVRTMRPRVTKKDRPIPPSASEGSSSQARGERPRIEVQTEGRTIEERLTEVENGVKWLKKGMSLFLGKLYFDDEDDDEEGPVATRVNDLVASLSSNSEEEETEAEEHFDQGVD